MHGRKKYRDVKGSTLEEEPGMLNKILGGEVRGNEESAGGKGSTGMWNETQAKQIVGGEIGRRAKAHKG